MERVLILFFFSCSLVAAIHAGDLKTCARNYQKVGCFTDKSDQSKSMLVYDRYGIQWKNIEAYMHNLACKCETEARKYEKYAGFAIHFWGECYGKTQAQLDAVDGKTQSNECTGDQRYKGCFEKDKECAGHADTDFVYSLTTPKVVIKTIRLCNDTGAELRCSGDTRIKLVEYSYGPRSEEVCGTPVSVDWTQNCNVFPESQIGVLSMLCANKRSCSLKGWNSNFQASCPGKPKYFELKYECNA